jgi:hypothetical protein
MVLNFNHYYFEFICYLPARYAKRGQGDFKFVIYRFD